MQSKIITALGFAVAVSSSPVKSVESLQTQLNTYPQVVRDIVGKSYCYEMISDPTVDLSTSLCKIQEVVQHAKLRKNILEFFVLLPSSSNISTSTWKKFIESYGPDIPLSFLESQELQLKKILALDEQTQTAFFQSENWNNYVNRFSDKIQRPDELIIYLLDNELAEIEKFSSVLEQLNSSQTQIAISHN